MAEDWQLEDHEGRQLREVRETRDRIKERVSQLLREIVPNQEAPHAGD